MLKFWQFEKNEYKNYTPELYFSKNEKQIGDKIIKETVGDNEFGSLLISNRYESQNGRYDEEGNEKILTYFLEKNKLPYFYDEDAYEHGYHFGAISYRVFLSHIKMYIDEVEHNERLLKHTKDPRYQYASVLTILKSDNTFDNKKQKKNFLKNTLIGVRIYLNKTHLKFHLKQIGSQKTLHSFLGENYNCKLLY